MASCLDVAFWKAIVLGSRWLGGKGCCGGVVGEVDAAAMASNRDLGWAPFDGDSHVPENGEGLSQRRAELPKERLSRVETKVTYGLDGNRVG